MKRTIIIFCMFLLFLVGCSNKKDTDIAGQKEFTIDDLKSYDGQNGNPAYVAVNGVVYDVTDSGLWKNGLHSQCSDKTYAGTDLTDLINSSPHGVAIMKKMPVVGTLQK